MPLCRWGKRGWGYGGGSGKVGRKGSRGKTQKQRMALQKGQGFGAGRRDKIA